MINELRTAAQNGDHMLARFIQGSDLAQQTVFANACQEKFDEHVVDTNGNPSRSITTRRVLARRVVAKVKADRLFGDVMHDNRVGVWEQILIYVAAYLIKLMIEKWWNARNARAV